MGQAFQLSDTGTNQMLLLVHIDLTNANLPQFDAYEETVLALLHDHGAKLMVRLRSTDGLKETHLLEFPDRPAFDAFRANPIRAAAQTAWEQCGATSIVTEVERIDHRQSP